MHTWEESTTSGFVNTAILQILEFWDWSKFNEAANFEAYKLYITTHTHTHTYHTHTHISHTHISHTQARETMAEGVPGTSVDIIHEQKVNVKLTV